MNSVYPMKCPEANQSTTWHLPALLPQGELVLLDGAAGIGKSIFAAQLAALLTRQSDKQKVIYISSPEQQQTRERFLHMQQARFEQLQAVDYLPLTVSMLDTMLPLHQHFISFVSDLLQAERPVCLIIDSLDELLSQGAEADARQCREFWINLRELASKHQCTIIVPRQQGLHETRQYGAMTKAGSELARFVLAMHWHPLSPAKRVVCVARHQTGAMGQQFHLQFDADGNMAIHEMKESQHVRPAKSPQTWQNDPTQKNREEEILTHASSFMKGMPANCQQLKSYICRQGFSRRAVDSTLAKAEFKAVSDGTVCYYVPSEKMQQQHEVQEKKDCEKWTRDVEVEAAMAKEARKEALKQARASLAREGVFIDPRPAW